ncbi:acyl-ACP--UDP-N-acetylglucosamine O-acyltransferase [Neptunicella marina]|uniref:Acyl-[acyl-carrier-protein]--UDP-N-acetylglucosamine O-acyltransferase n=1 Tax=Neptunicella marina TaxID=2125989 RepID=A0A8J6IPU3_9ALTE|nr:acyl-ACP--UDP-N-acetylglucosamine O-acyltransferase [Neptunicella marina]MBC3764881.1 acyl-ACP--UDP-N-acetylglucosamine O-acyltransferase [Neptunicella marina]
MSVHPTAIIDPSASLGENVEVGPFTIIGANVVIGDNCKIESHVVIKGPSQIGRDNHIFQFCSIGEDCQDKKYAGEPTRLVIGDNNVFREGCTVHRGTIQDQSLTQIGSHNLFMADAHVAHDCVIGDNNIFANNATLAGHVHVGDWVIIGGMTGVHQFCHIGSHSFCAAGCLLVKDLPPYVMAGGADMSTFGINSEGLKRRGFDSATISQIRRAYKVVYRQGHKVDEAVSILNDMANDTPPIKILADFIQHSARGILR